LSDYNALMTYFIVVMNTKQIKNIPPTKKIVECNETNISSYSIFKLKVIKAVLVLK
jgi:hypothetical protein